MLARRIDPSSRESGLCRQMPSLELALSSSRSRIEGAEWPRWWRSRLNLYDPMPCLIHVNYPTSFSYVHCVHWHSKSQPKPDPQNNDWQHQSRQLCQSVCREQKSSTSICCGNADEYVQSEGGGSRDRFQGRKGEPRGRICKYGPREAGKHQVNFMVSLRVECRLTCF